ncbi:MAG: DsbA family protein [Crocinitomicaceae bacterium]|nr:DsbA family protein [Crocinitomicaceae bacterium]|tara:strand:+ start:27664 stop:28329 length:666 start_codon:yes stop_codon:yes gene_type:complete
MKWLSSLLLIFLMNVVMSQDTIYYIGDPLCSWCYGFAPQISKVKEHYQGDLEFKIIMGGLRPNNTETMKDLGDFLKHHWEQVEERSGQPFNYKLLEDHSFVYDTEPPARAVWVVRQLKPEVEFAFFKDVQLLFYSENRNTNQLDNYQKLIEKYNIDWNQFKELFHSEVAINGVKQDFQFSSQLGVRGFPSVLLKRKYQWFLVSNGYTDASNIQKTIDKVLK